MRNYYHCYILFVCILLQQCQANFEDTRCRCICPSTEFFRTHNNTPDENFRRYYTKTNVNSLKCNTQNVVKESVRHIVDDNRIDAFLANCNCKFESRNSLLLKDVVLLVIFVILGLAGYMAYLVVVDQVLRRPAQFVPYRRQEDDLEDNIFANSVATALSPSHQSSSDDLVRTARSTATANSSSPETGIQMRTSRVAVLDKVEAEQNKWKNSVEEQRRKVMTEHTLLN